MSTSVTYEKCCVCGARTKWTRPRYEPVTCESKRCAADYEASLRKAKPTREETEQHKADNYDNTGDDR